MGWSTEYELLQLPSEIGYNIISRLILENVIFSVYTILYMQVMYLYILILELTLLFDGLSPEFASPSYEATAVSRGIPLARFINNPHFIR